MSGARRRTTAGFRKKVLLKLPDAMGTSLSHVYFVQSPCNSGTIPTESIRYSNRYFPTTLYSPLIGKGEGVVGE